MSQYIHPSDSFDAAMSKVCQDLPPGWGITIELERGSGCVRLTNSGGQDVEFQYQHDCLLDELNEALSHAQECDGGLEDLANKSLGDFAGNCQKCGGEIFHRIGHPGEYDHECQPAQGE